MTPKEAFNDITHELRQRHMDMYTDYDKESVSLVIDEMNKRETIVDQALTELEELKRDVSRYFELWEQAREKWGNGLDDKETHEYTKLHLKLMKVGKEE